MSNLATQIEETRAINLPLMDILCHAWFREGYKEAAKGLPFHFFCTTKSDEMDKWFYERGRLVAGEARSAYGRVPQLWFETDAGSIINPQVISLAGAMFMTGAFA